MHERPGRGKLAPTRKRELTLHIKDFDSRWRHTRWRETQHREAASERPPTLQSGEAGIESLPTPANLKNLVVQPRSLDSNGLAT